MPSAIPRQKTSGEDPADALRKIREYTDPSGVEKILGDIRHGRLTLRSEEMCKALAPLATGLVGGTDRIDGRNSDAALQILRNSGLLGVDAIARVFIGTRPAEVTTELCSALYTVLKANPGQISDPVCDKLIPRLTELEAYAGSSLVDTYLVDGTWSELEKLARSD